MSGPVSRLTRLLTLGGVDLDRRASGKAAIARACRAANQVRIDAMLPAFLTGDAVHPPVGTDWVTLADLALRAGHREGGRVFDVLDLAPIEQRAARDPLLPRGSSLRLLEPFWDIWAFGYLAGIFFGLTVEDGPLAGRTVRVSEDARHSWARGRPRETLAAALIVPPDDPAAQGVVVARSRYDLIVQILRDITPTTRPGDGLPGEPVAFPSDLAAIGCATPDP